MFPFYFTGFFLTCILGFWGWIRVLQHRSGRTILICSGISLVIFVAFCLRDAQNVKIRYEQISKIRNDPTYYDESDYREESPYNAAFNRHEQELLVACKWNTHNGNWKDPQNLENAYYILQNVMYDWKIPDILLQSEEDPDYRLLKQEPVTYLGQLYEIEGWCSSATVYDDEQIVQGFLRDTEAFDLMYMECSFSKNTEPTYILMTPKIRSSGTAYAGDSGRTIDNGIFIGLTDEGLPVFLSR